MIKSTLALGVMLGLAGCASQPGSQPQANNNGGSQGMMAVEAQGPSHVELAAYAGAHPYPANTPAKDDLRAAAIVNLDQGIIKVYNFGTDPIRDADVWVNQSYVRHVNGIAPGGSASVPMSSLYNSLGQQFAARGEHVNLVQVQQDHTLHTLMGPAAQ